MEARSTADAPKATDAVLRFPPRAHSWGPVTRARQARSIALYGCAFVVAIGAIATSARADVEAFALGLILPGGGFLLWAGSGSPVLAMASGLAALSFFLFLISLAVWFATGNVVLPLAVWLSAAIGAAGIGGMVWGAESLWRPAVLVVPLGVIAALALVAAAESHARRCGLRRRDGLNAALQTADKTVFRGISTPASSADELSQEDLQCMRLLLDRALQPVGDFDGFEWTDQFQTAAVRYQLNAASYALSVAQRVHLPAFQGYLRTAQSNLAAKQQDHRVWRYWRLENLWGNLRLSADPIPRDNIMLTGFLAAQLAYAQAASGDRAFDASGSLAFEHPSGARYSYSLPALIEVLTGGYRESGYGLLACEPNWIYPLCNIISATAIRAQDAAHGTDHWEAIADSFRRRLEAEFITLGGRFVACRSSYTGFAAPPIGGAVMQAFPCLFLNAILPDIAQRQWLALRHDLAGRDWRRAFWPIDVGNYRFSRGASYAASAAAAVELGDSDMARRLLQHLDDECPMQVSGGVAHRPKASLWVHGIELIARGGRAGALRSLVTVPACAKGLHIAEAAYPDILVAKAVREGDALLAVLYPGAESGAAALTLGGLTPRQFYVVSTGGEHRVAADRCGNARVEVLLDGRTELRVAPSV